MEPGHAVDGYSSTIDMDTDVEPDEYKLETTFDNKVLSRAMSLLV